MDIYVHANISSYHLEFTIVSAADLRQMPYNTYRSNILDSDLIRYNESRNRKYLHLQNKKHLLDIEIFNKQYKRHLNMQNNTNSLRLLGSRSTFS